MTIKLEIDTSQQGLRMILEKWEEETLRIFWGNPQEEFISRIIYEHTNQRLKPESISRASIINFLEDMTLRGVLNKREITGKGGYRGVYSSKMDESGFKTLIAETVIDALMRNFSEETKQTIAKLS